MVDQDSGCPMHSTATAAVDGAQLDFSADMS